MNEYKGFEITYRDQTVAIDVNEQTSVSVIVQKIRGKFDLMAHGFIYPDKHLYGIYEPELKEGDEIIITRKNVAQSPYLRNPADAVEMQRGCCSMPLNPEEKGST
ncbi:MAG: hypothetical protein LBD59_08285 [Prevotellaceae bacterium]|jgi:hypothetical protein|nr:hypothetical protein [Prevotellaceae bacterium]